MATVLPPGAKCVLCEKTDNLLRCARCKSTFYCSRDCQKKDWTQHKKTCKPSTEAAAALATVSQSTANVSSLAAAAPAISKSAGSLAEKPVVPPKPAKQLVRASSTPGGASTQPTQGGVGSSSKLNPANVQAGEAPLNRSSSTGEVERTQQSGAVSQAASNAGAEAARVADPAAGEKGEKGAKAEAKEGEKEGGAVLRAPRKAHREPSTIINMTVSPSPASSKSPLSKKFLRQEDVPPALSGFEYKRAKDNVDANLVILLHGLGDTMANYCSLATSLSLPQCCTLCLQAPNRLPLDCGFSWFPMFEADGSLIEPTSTTTSRHRGLMKSRDLLVELLHTLIEKYEWLPENIFLMGFSQGAIVSLETALHCKNATGGARLGGCLLFSDSLLDEAMMKGHTTISWPDRSLMTETATPIFVSHGTADKTVPLNVASDKVSALRQVVMLTQGTVEFKEYNKGHQMINSSEEVRDVFTFLSKHMVMRNPALEKDSSLYSVDSTA